MKKMSSDSFFTLVVEGIQVVWGTVWCWCGHWCYHIKHICITKLLPYLCRVFSKPNKPREAGDET